MKNSIHLFFLLLTALSFGQGDIIQNQKTEEYFHVPGTKYSLILPGDNYQNSDQGTGVYDPKTENGIAFTELPLNYTDILESFSKELPEKKEIIEINKNYTINGYQATLIKTKEETRVSWVLLFGNDSFSLIITSIYKPEFDTQLSDSTEKSLLSFYYMAEEKVNPMDQLSYTIDTKGTPYKFAMVLMQTGAAFTQDGKFPSELEQKSGYMILAFPYFKEQKEQAIHNFKKPTEKHITIDKTKQITINGLKGYQVLGYEEKEDVKKVKNVTTLFSGEMQYILMGVSDHDPIKSMEHFSSMAQSFKLKK